MKGQKGFTLAELVSSLGVFSILVLLATVLSSWAIYRYYSVRDRMLAEEMAYRAEVAFKSFFSQAVDVNYSSGSVPQNLGGQTGRIYHNSVIGSGQGFLFDQRSDSSNWTRVATFYREQSTGLTGGAAASGSLMKTAIFYREPTPTTSGVIFFDISSPSSSNALVSPDWGDLYVDRVSTFGMTKFTHSIHNKTTSVEVYLKFRYHSFSGSGTNWCPQLDIQSGTSGCGIQTTWRDLEKRFMVVLSNNLMKTQGSYTASAVAAEERTLGGLYFFRLVQPLRYQ